MEQRLTQSTLFNKKHGEKPILHSRSNNRGGGVEMNQRLNLLGRLK